MPEAKSAVVLVVEDDPLVLLSAVDIIEEAGYQALQASDADEAIAILEANPEIHVVFTDIEMPGSMDGLKLAAFIRDRWPPVEIIITSGRVPADDVTLPDRGVFLQKPYRPQELTEQLDRLL